MIAGLKIARPIAPDAPALTQLAFAAKRHWGYPDSWIEAWRDVLTITADSVRNNDLHMAVVANQIVGFYGLLCENDVLHLNDLWVRPESMGMGIGRALFMHAMARAAARGFAEVNIESDPNSEGFYLRMGASRVGTRLTEMLGLRRELPLLTFRLRKTPE